MLVHDTAAGFEGSNPSNFTGLGAGAFYLTRRTDQRALDGFYRSDVGSLVTERLAAMREPDNLHLLEGERFYWAGDITVGRGSWARRYGQGVWSSDGTVKGSGPCLDANPGPIYSAPDHFIHFRGLILFTGPHNKYQVEFAIAPYETCEQF